MMEGVNSTKISCKNFCKCHNVPQYNIIIFKKREKRTMSRELKEKRKRKKLSG
jgi:hypothetical protein